MAKARKKFKLPRGVEKARKKVGRALTRYRLVYEILAALLVVGILFFGMRGTLCLALRTGDPYRGVISDSMKHSDDLWRNYFLTRGYDTSSFPLQGGFERGDLMFVQGVNSLEDIRIGDIIVFNTPFRTIPLVHRVVAITNVDGQFTFTTKGDANPSSLFDEQSIMPEQIVGRVVFVIPKLGYLSLWFQGQ